MIVHKGITRKLEDEVEQEDYQERIMLQLEEQEEEDFNRIKEESKRRMQQKEPPLEDIVEENETSFSVGKYHPLNGVSAFEKFSGTGGLGEGTPKATTLGKYLMDDMKLLLLTGKASFQRLFVQRYLKAGSTDLEEVVQCWFGRAGYIKEVSRCRPRGNCHCSRFLSSFKYRNHLCLVFESLHRNLREVLKCRNIRLRLSDVRAYAKQLFIALKHLRNCGILYSDIKLDNMLVNDPKNVLMLCEFVLGLPYDHPLDIYGLLVAVCLSFIMGKFWTNNDMLRLHMELKCPFLKKMLRKTIKRLKFKIKRKDFDTIILSFPGEYPKVGELQRFTGKNTYVGSI